MYEHRSEPLLHRAAFLRRAFGHAASSLGLVAAADGIGTLGYHVLGGLPWLDAFLNASMILGGMGPVDHLDAPVAKVFAACYALFSGLVFVVGMGLVLGPWAHRLMHHVQHDR